MKIVSIVTRLNVGGPARQVVWLTRGLAAAGHDVHLVSGTIPSGEDDMHYFAEANGVDTEYISGLSRELSFSDIASVAKVYRQLRKHAPDIVHTHTAKAGTVGRIAAFLYRWATPKTLIGRARKVRVVHTFHGHIFHSYYGPAKTYLFKLIERALARGVTSRIVVLSSGQLEDINGRAGIGRPEQFRIVPIGLDLEEFSVAERSDLIKNEIGASPDTLVVGFLGRLTEIKAVPLLLESFARYVNRQSAADPDLRLAIIGDGNIRGSLEELSKTNGTEKFVTFLGSRKDTAELLAGIDIVAMTSLNEGTPLSLIEAMAAGKPVISTMVGGVVDLLGKKVKQKDGFIICERGIGIESRDPADLLNGVLYLAENESVRSSLAVAAREYVFQNHSLERLERDMISIYNELLNA